MMFRFTLFLLLILFTACEEKATARVTKSNTLATPISCLKIDALGLERSFFDKLNSLYMFNNSCDLTLHLSSKKDIVCNSSYNMMSKNMGKFPKSFLKLEIRRGMKIEYSYYIDLFHNVNEDDIEEGFGVLKRDVF